MLLHALSPLPHSLALLLMTSARSSTAKALLSLPRFSPVLLQPLSIDEWQVCCIDGGCTPQGPVIPESSNP